MKFLCIIYGFLFVIMPYPGCSKNENKNESISPVPRPRRILPPLPTEAPPPIAIWDTDPVFSSPTSPSVPALLSLSHNFSFINFHNPLWGEPPTHRPVWNLKNSHQPER